MPRRREGSLQSTTRKGNSPMERRAKSSSKVVSALVMEHSGTDQSSKDGDLHGSTESTNSRFVQQSRSFRFA